MSKSSNERSIRAAVRLQGQGIAAALVVLCAVMPAAADEIVPLTDSERRIILQMSPVPPLPPDPTNRFADDPVAALLGQHLFFEPGMSRDGTVACASCHEPARAFTDGMPLGRGISDVTRNTMSLVDVGHARWLFWDGRADTLWAQALDPIEDPREHGFDRVGAVRLVAEDALLRDLYIQRFGALPRLDDADRFPVAARPVPQDPGHPHQDAWSSMREEDQEAINGAFVNLGKSIAAYERRLLGGPSAFDKFVESLRDGNGTQAARFMSPSAQRGMVLFIGRANCRLCHSGPRFTDDEFHSSGVPDPRGGPTRDAGRYEGIRKLQASPFRADGAFSDDPNGPDAVLTQRTPADAHLWGLFRTPSLRGVGQTAPYMHDGTLPTLESVVRHYATLDRAAFPGHHVEQLLEPLELSEGDIADLVAFLESLTPAPVDAALQRPPGVSPPADEASE